MINVSQLVQDALDGNENPLRAYAILKQLQKQVADGIREIEDGAMAEADRFGEKTFETMNYKFELRDGSRRYSFKNIQAWTKLNDKIKNLESQCKQAAIAFEKGNTIVDDDGEVVPVPEVSFTKPSIVVKPI